jgi:HK97 gp10 family phage protein
VPHGADLMANIEVRTNLPDFTRQIIAFGRDFERKTVRSATAAAAGVFKKLAIAKAPVDSGLLKRAMYRKRSRRSTRGAEQYFVGFRQGKAQQNAKVYKGFTGNLDAYHGRFLEYGWVPRGPGKKLRGGRRSVALQRERALAAGAAKITKYRFMHPAFERGRDEALRVFFARIEQRIDRENRKR